MKRYIAILLFIVALPTAAAAQVRTSYFMEGSTFRTDMNPALAPTRGYFNFPMLGGVSVGINNNFLSIENMLYPTDNGLVTFMHKSVDRNKFLKRLPRNNALGISATEQLIGFGYHTKRFFWSAGMNIRLNADVNIPKDFFSLITSLGQGSYNMDKMHAGMSAYLETFVGAAIPIKEIATVGFRVKALTGVANASFNVNNTAINVTDTEVSARLAGELVGSFPMANTNLPAGTPVNMEDIVAEELDMQRFADQSKNFGIAFDLGAEVRLLDDQLRVSAAITDLGFISWNKAATIKGELGGAFAYKGFNFEDSTISTEQEPFEFVSAAVDGNYAQRLNCSLNFGAEYAILRNRISFGLLSHTQFCQTYAFSELTASVNFKPINWFTATLSHTLFNKNQPGIFGFALNLHPAGFNIFLGADYIALKYAPLATANGGQLLLPIRQRSFNLNFGLGFSLGRAKYTKAYKEDLAAGRIKAKKSKK